MTRPPSEWPSVLVPLPVRFTFDPAGSMIFTLSGLPGGMDVARNAEHYVETARVLFGPHVKTLNTAPNLGERTPEAYTELPPWDEVEDEVRRWLA